MAKIFSKYHKINPLIQHQPKVNTRSAAKYWKPNETFNGTLKHDIAVKSENFAEDSMNLYCIVYLLFNECDELFHTKRMKYKKNIFRFYVISFLNFQFLHLNYLLL